MRIAGRGTADDDFPKRRSTMVHSPSPPLPWPARATDAHKGNFGRALLVGGSRGMAGSIALASIAALQTGSGLVSAAVPDRCLETVAGFHPSIMTIPLRDSDSGHFAGGVELPDLSPYDVIGCGPGMRPLDGSIEIVAALLQQIRTMRVFDADALNIIAQEHLFDRPAPPRDQSAPPRDQSAPPRDPSTLPGDQSTLVLTPHPGELARLTGVSPKDRDGQIDAAESLVERFGLTIVVKGGPTVVIGKPDRDAAAVRYVNPTGNPGMATAGTGDVLTGVVTSLAGQGLSGWDAARLGVFVHGSAGDIAARRHSQAAMTSLELLHCLPEAIGSLE
jgi:NAD(P)H-hydrate epimerase